VTTSIPRTIQNVSGSPRRDEGPLKLPFVFRRKAPPGGDGFVLERRRKGSDDWDVQGWFASRGEAKRAARDLARHDLGLQCRIRPAPPKVE
jgi:hypothetical protein